MRGEPGTAARRDASMSLLVDLLHGEGSLDAGYAEAARRRATTADASARRRTPALRFASGAALLAVGLATGAVLGQLRGQRPAELRARDALRVEAAAESARLDRVGDALTRARAGLESGRSGGRSPDGVALSVAAGLGPVRGPGVEVVVDDAPTRQAGRVLDRDLQRLVNSLWASGAEAVAVGGQRLTTTSAIRTAGAAILVGYRPLHPPYLVQAVGAPGMLPGLATSPGLRQLQTLSASVGLRLQVRPERELALPGAVPPLLRHADADGRASR